MRNYIFNIIYFDLNQRVRNAAVAQRPYSYFNKKNLDIQVDLAHLHRPCRKHLDTEWTKEAEDAVRCQRGDTENERGSGGAGSDVNDIIRLSEWSL